MTSLIRLQWQKDPQGYEIAARVREPTKRKLISDGEAGPYLAVAPRSGRTESYVVEGTEARIFLELAETPLSHEGLIKFANRWGLLVAAPEQDVQDFYGAIRETKRLAELACAQSLDDIERRLTGKVRLDMKFGRLSGDRVPRMFLEAPGLHAFCVAEFLQLIGGGVEIRKCLRCGTLLALGKVGKQPMYCSDACRVAMHRKNKRVRALRSAPNVVLADRSSQ